MAHQRELTGRPGCLSVIAQLFGAKPQPSISQSTAKITPHYTGYQPIANDNVVHLPEEPVYPFKTKRYLLSKAEISFYHVLRSAVQDKLVICPKMRLGDILYADTRDYKYWNQINQKHLDFLLCHPETLKP